MIRQAAAAGIAGREPARPDPVAHDPLQDPVPGQVQALRRGPQGRAAGRLGPGVEPELEGPVGIGWSVGAEERDQSPLGVRGRIDGRLDPRQVGGSHTVESCRQHVVHRLEVVVDEPAGRAHLGGHVADRRRGEALSAGDGEGSVDGRLASTVGTHSGHGRAL